MKHTKRAMSCGVVTAAMIVTAVAASLSGNVTDTSQSSQQVYKEIVVLAETQDTTTKETTKAKGTIEATTLAVATDVAADVSALTSETADSAWADKLMADVDKALNVRKEASKNADVVGKLYKGSIAEVVEAGEEWTKIKSGNVEGYVKNEYCVFGEDAKALAEEVCDKYATSKTGGLKVRYEAKEEENAKLLHVMEEGEKLIVDTTAEECAGWVAVTYNDATGYVSEGYVTVAYDYTKAMTLEEEKAAEKAAEEAKYEEMAKSAKTSASVSSDDVKLLAALIFCEAGGESYEGQLAVGAVVMNRVESGSYPSTIEGVIYQKGQFTPAGNGKVQRTIDNGKHKNCLSAAQAALSGQDNTGGALHFNAGKGKGKQIGNQHFW